MIPVETVRTHPLGRALGRIADVAKEREAIEVIIGLPRHLSGAEGTSAQKARRFAVSLARRLPDVRIALVDERLSTNQAQIRLHEAGVNALQQRNVVDQVAAQIILERALEIERLSSEPPGEEVRGPNEQSERPDNE